MTQLRKWYEACRQRAAVLADACELPIEVSDDRTHAGLLAAGFPGVLPLWKVREMTVGLLAEPSVSPERWRGVVVEDKQGATVCADASMLLPNFLFRRFLLRGGSSLENLRRSWTNSRPLFATLHRELGGTENGLARLDEALDDPRLTEAVTYDSKDPAPFDRMMSSIARRIDPSPEFSRFADWLDGAIAGEIRPAMAPSDYGVWARPCFAWAEALLESRPHEPVLPSGILASMVLEYAGLDTGAQQMATWAAFRPSGSVETNQVRMARDVDLDTLGADPVLRGLVQTLRAKHFDYDGYTHAEALVVLDERGEPERAWGTLHSAAWWMAERLGRSPPAILDGARLLCDRHGWDDLRWVVDRNAGGDE